MNEPTTTETCEAPYVAPQFEVVDLQDAIGNGSGSSVHENGLTF